MHLKWQLISVHSGFWYFIFLRYVFIFVVVSIKYKNDTDACSQLRVTLTVVENTKVVQNTILYTDRKRRLYADAQGEQVVLYNTYTCKQRHAFAPA